MQLTSDGLRLLEIVARREDTWEDLRDRLVTTTRLREAARLSAGVTFEEAVSTLVTAKVLAHEQDVEICRACAAEWPRGTEPPEEHQREHVVSSESRYRLSLPGLESSLAATLAASWQNQSLSLRWRTDDRGVRLLSGSMASHTFDILWFPHGQIQEAPGLLLAIPERRDMALPEVYWLDAVRPERANDLRQWVSAWRVWAVQDSPVPPSLPAPEERIVARLIRRYFDKLGAVPRPTKAHEIPALEAVAAGHTFQTWQLGEAVVTLCTAADRSMPSRWLLMSSGSDIDREHLDSAVAHLVKDLNNWLDRRGFGELMFALFSNTKTIASTLGLGGVSVILTRIPRDVADLTGAESVFTLLTMAGVTVIVAAVVAYALWLSISLARPLCPPRPTAK